MNCQVKNIHQLKNFNTVYLQSPNSCTLESQVGLEVLSNFSYKTLERQFSDEQLCGFLVPSDFSESDCSWPVPMGLLYTTSGGSTLTCSLCGKLFTRSFSSCTFTSCLLCTCHSVDLKNICSNINFYTTINSSCQITKVMQVYCATKSLSKILHSLSFKNQGLYREIMNIYTCMICFQNISHIVLFIYRF